MTRSSYGPEERHLLETSASRIYANAVAHGSLRADDPRLAAGSELRPALDLLVDIGLLRHDDATGLLLPGRPGRDPVPGRRAARRPGGRAAHRVRALGRRVQRARPGLPHLAAAAVSPITEIHGLDNINNFIHAAVNDSRQELLTAQPHGRRPANTLAEAEDRDLKALDRGVRMRTLYQHSARHSPATREYVADIVARGAEVRTLDEFFRRLIVIDRQVAVVPASDNHHVAIAIHDKSLIAYLVDIFERSWERAQPFNLSAATRPSATSPPTCGR